MVSSFLYRCQEDKLAVGCWVSLTWCRGTVSCGPGWPHSRCPRRCWCGWRPRWCRGRRGSSCSGDIISLNSLYSMGGWLRGRYSRCVCVLTVGKADNCRGVITIAHCPVMTVIVPTVPTTLPTLLHIPHSDYLPLLTHLQDLELGWKLISGHHHTVIDLIELSGSFKFNGWFSREDVSYVCTLSGLSGHLLAL